MKIWKSENNMNDEQKRTWSRILSNQEEQSNFDQYLKDDQRRVCVFSQLSDIGLSNIEELERDLNFIVFKVDENNPDFNLKIEIPSDFPCSPFKVDPASEIIVDKDTTLQEVFNKHNQKVQEYKPIWQALSGLESRARVLEESRSLWDCKRIIPFAPGICIEIHLDPSEPFSPPKIIILGPDRKIQPLLSSLAINIDLYDPDQNLALNIERILEVELPAPSTQLSEKSSLDEENIDCGICYVYQLDNALPTEVCDKCSRPFHMECLHEYLSTSHGVTRSHNTNTIFGKCPICDTDIFCQIQIQP